MVCTTFCVHTILRDQSGPFKVCWLRAYTQITEFVYDQWVDMVI